MYTKWALARALFYPVNLCLEFRELCAVDENFFNSKIIKYRASSCFSFPFGWAKVELTKTSKLHAPSPSTIQIISTNDYINQLRACKMFTRSIPQKNNSIYVITERSDKESSSIIVQRWNGVEWGKLFHFHGYHIRNLRKLCFFTSILVILTTNCC